MLDREDTRDERDQDEADDERQFDVGDVAELLAGQRDAGERW